MSWLNSNFLHTYFLKQDKSRVYVGLAAIKSLSMTLSGGSTGKFIFVLHNRI